MNKVGGSGGMDPNTRRLDTDAEIDEYLDRNDGLVVGLNGSDYVQLQLPVSCNYIVLSPAQADALAELLKKWAEESRKKGHR